MIEYKSIIARYELSSLLKKEIGNADSLQSTFEVDDWNKALNRYAKDGWVVANSGVIESGGNMVFWALLEREEKLKGTILT